MNIAGDRVVSLNVRRRHLTPSQMGAAMANLETLAFSY